MEWLSENWRALLAVPVVAGVFHFLWLYAMMKWKGSRRSSKNWGKNRELSGDVSLLKLGVKRINPDTTTTEGDAASVYYETYTTYVYEVVNGVRLCFLRSFVVQVYAFYQWKTVNGLGDNVMTQFASDPIPCMGLEEKKDDKGNSYWVKIPVKDVAVLDPLGPSS